MRCAGLVNLGRNHGEASRLDFPLSQDEPNTCCHGTAQSGHSAFLAFPSRVHFWQVKLCGHGLRSLSRFFWTSVPLCRQEICGARSATICAKLLAVYDAVLADGDDVHDSVHLVRDNSLLARRA